MKNISRYFAIMSLMALGSQNAIMGQITGQAPTPALWFSFNGGTYLTANLGSANMITTTGHTVSQVPDRFGNASSAVSFWSASDKLSTLVATNTANSNPAAVTLFGWGSPSTPLPSRFTISCWVYVDPTDLTYYRKLFYADYSQSRFAIVQKGPDIYMRRIENTTGNSNRFDYYFGAPASFDAGAGWYQVILVMGVRSTDKAAYSKLYVGKPLQVKYDATGPRTLPAGTSDALATNFGGSYAFEGVQNFMNSGVSAWGLGNADSNDPIYGGNVAPVRQMDDFTVWSDSLSDMQAAALFNCEKASPANQCWVTTGGNNTLPATLNGSSARLDSLVNSGELTVFPNPTSGELWVRLPASGDGSETLLSLLDLTGKQLWTRRLTAAPESQTIDFGNIRSMTHAAGIYLLRVVLSGQQKTFKIVLE